MGRRFKYRERMMIENSMFYMNFEASSEQQEACIEKIKEAGSDDVNPIYLLKKPIIDKKADYDYKDAFVVLMPKHKMIFINLKSFRKILLRTWVIFLRNMILLG